MWWNPGHHPPSALLLCGTEPAASFRFPQPQTAHFQEPWFKSAGASCPEMLASWEGTTCPSGTTARPEPHAPRGARAGQVVRGEQAASTPLLLLPGWDLPVCRVLPV